MQFQQSEEMEQMLKEMQDQLAASAKLAPSAPPAEGTA